MYVIDERVSLRSASESAQMLGHFVSGWHSAFRFWLMADS
jgi:hypothetical protein